MRVLLPFYRTPGGSLIISNTFHIDIETGKDFMISQEKVIVSPGRWRPSLVGWRPSLLGCLKFFFVQVHQIVEVARASNWDLTLMMEHDIRRWLSV